MHVVVYLNEQKVECFANTDVLADEFALTHKGAFSSPTWHDTMVSPGVDIARSPQVSQWNLILAGGVSIVRNLVISLLFAWC